MMRAIRWLSLAGSLILWSGWAPKLVAQEPRWEVPAGSIVVDIQSEKSTAKASFLPRGFAWVVPIEFPMLRDSLTVVAKHREPGMVDLVVKTLGSSVELQPAEKKPLETSFSVKGKVPALDRQGAQARAKELVAPILAPHIEQARRDAASQTEMAMRRYLRTQEVVAPDDPEALRKVYADARGTELAASDLRDALEKFAREKPAWVSAQDEQDAKRATPQQLLAGYLRLLHLRVAEEHLRQCGIELETSRRNFEALILTKLEGTHGVMRGVAAGNADAARGVRALTADEMASLRKSLSVGLELQFFPLADANDGNSQWFGAQRVVCSVRGANVVRVHGRLSPPTDSTDWWTLRAYDPTRQDVKVVAGEGLKSEYFPDGADTRLRISSTTAGELTYTLEISPRGVMAVEGVPVELFETPVSSDAKFPF